METALAIFAASIVGCVVIGALILMLATRIAAGFFPRFAHALLATTLSGVGWLVVCWAVALTLGLSAAGALVLCVASYAIDVGLVYLFVRHADGRVLGWGRACAAATIQVAIEVVIAFVVMVMAGAEILYFLGRLH